MHRSVEGGFLDDYPYRAKYGVFIRSPHLHARMLNTYVSKAISEGLLVLTGKDFAASTVSSTGGGASLETPPIAVGKARY